MSELDDATSALQALSYRTPLEDSLPTITAAMSTEGNLKVLLERILEEPSEHGPVTVSLGVAARPESVTLPEEMLGGAYRSVSDAKRHSGNCVAVL
jgi:hypothetical protein